MHKLICSLAFAILTLTINSFAQPTAQWRGPERNGHYPSTGIPTGETLLQSWPEQGPPLLWSVESIGKGYSTAITDGNTIFVTGKKGDQDYLSAINMQGKIIWQVPFGPSWTGSFPESRCTPTLDNGKLYVLSGSGTIACISATDGKSLWSFDVLSKFKGVYGDWGVCESLLISGNKVIYTPAGTLTTMVALDKETGETIWKTESLNDTSAYVSPILIDYGGKKMIITVINKYLFGVDESTGKILWKFDYGDFKAEQCLRIWPGAPKTNTISPLYNNGEIYITGGYDHVGVKFKISDDASAVSPIWTDSTLDCHMGGVVLVDGYIYGSNWQDNAHGNWCCIDWKTGKTMYESHWNTKGSIIEAVGKLYCFEEKNANVALVNPTPNKFDLISTFKAPYGTGPSWAHPSIYHGILLIRRGDVLMAYDIKQH